MLSGWEINIIIALDYGKIMLTGINLFNIDDLTDETKEMASVSAGDTNDLPF